MPEQISLPPELELVLNLCLLPPTERERANALRLAGQVANWDEFVFWVQRHGVLGSVLENLKTLPADLIPPGPRTRLNQAQRQASMRDMQLIAALAQIDKLFRPQGLEFLALKGPALSQLLFGAPFTRHSSDLDILVSIEDVKKAENLLLSWGCQRKEPEQELTQKQFEYYLKFNHHCTFTTPNNNLPIELHWSIREPYLFNAQASHKMMKRGFEVSLLNGLLVKTLCPEDAFVHALLHGAVHRWNRARFFTDLAGAAYHMLDTKHIQTIITNENLQIIIKQASIVSSCIFQKDLTDLQQKNKTTQDQSNKFINRVALQNFYSRDPAPFTIKPRRIQYEPRLKPGWRYFYYAFFESFVNSSYWGKMALPDWLFGVYFLIVPSIGIYKKLIKPLFYNTRNN